MKNCKKIHPLLSLYQEGELSGREKMAVERHVSGCPSARAELERLERLHKALKKLPEPPLPHDLHDKIMANFSNSAKSKKNILWFNPAWTLTAAAAALALIVLTQYPRFTRKPQKEILAMNKTAPSAPSKDKLEEQAAPANKPAPQPFLEYKPMVLASKVRALRKKTAEQKDLAGGDVNLVINGAAASNEVASAKTTIPPTIVVAMAAPPAQAPVERTAVRKLPLVTPENASGASADLVINEPQGLKTTGAGQAAPMIGSPNVVQDLNVQINVATKQTLTPLSGNFSPVTIEDQELITDNTTFQAEWDKVQQGQPLPSVDFTTQSVVLLNAGNQPTTGYSIKVSRSEETADQLIVHYQVLAPEPGTPEGQIVTRPWSMQVIPKPAKPVLFTKDP